jgi:hypothetical protein
MRAPRRITSVAGVSIGVVVLVLGTVGTEPAWSTGGHSARSSAAAALSNCQALVPFHRANFPRRPRITNRFLPLRPGTNIVLAGTVREDDGRLHAHKILSTVSRVTKVIDGVRTRVVFERDVEDGQLQESELAFEAQDRYGRVWNMGEYPEEYENGKIVGADTWIAGVAHAHAGIAMRAHPRVGPAAYLQGVAPSVDFRDCGKVVRTGRHRCEPHRCVRHVLVVEEYAPLEPRGGQQLKYYGPRIGNVEVGAVGGKNPEVLRLARHSTLSRAALTEINRRVLAQDHRGYRVSRKVYGRTRPAQLRPPGGHG